MKAGRELDAEISEKVFGLKVVSRDWPCGYDPECGVYGATHFMPPIGGWFDERGPIIASDEEGWPPQPSWEEDLGDSVPKDEVSAYVEPVPFYSINIADADKVIEKLVELGFRLVVERYKLQSGDRGATAKAYDATGWVAGSIEATAPLAVCLLALNEDLTIP